MQQAIYFGVNKNGKLRMFTEDPIRKDGYWIGKYYVNSVIYSQLLDVIKNTKLSWEDDSQCIQITCT